MRRTIVLKCTACGAPAADSAAICPYCRKATAFDSLAHTPGVDLSDAGSMRVSDGAHVHIGASGDSRGACPFCGANPNARDKKNQPPLAIAKSRGHEALIDLLAMYASR